MNINLKSFTKLLLDFTVNALFVLFTLYFLKFILNSGPTNLFLERSYKLVGIVFILLSITFLISLINNVEFKFKKRFEFSKLKDVYLIAVPLSPVIGYAILNNDYLNFQGLLYLFGFPLIFIFILCFVLPSIFSYFGSLNILFISGLAICFTVLTMPIITSNPNSHFFKSQFVTQGIYLTLSFLIMYIFYLFNKTIAYTFAIVFMLTGALGSILYKLSDKDFVKNETQEKLKIFLNKEENKIYDQRNIYIMVYESYPNFETLQYYGYNDTSQVKYLEENNFTIYHGAYSNGASSLSSISRMFEINGNISNHERYYTSGNAFGLKIFQANNYKIESLFISPYFFGAYPITWDNYYPKANINKIGGKTLTQSIYKGEFRFNIFDNNFNYEKYLEMKNQFLISKKSKPTLFYTHNSYPGHSQNSGKCSPSEKKRFFKNLKKANIEMKNDINTIKQNDPKSIVVLLGDHGPYLTKNCTVLRTFDVKNINKHDVQDRYGTLLAINWPDDIDSGLNELQIIQDIFPAILSNITSNNKLFDELKVGRKFYDRFHTNIGGVNVSNGVIIGGKDNGKPMFDKRSYKINIE